MNVAGLLLLAIPLAFGVLRLLTTGADFRYVVVAMAAAAGALAALSRSRRPTRLALVHGVVAFLVSAACAAVASALLGARSVVAIAAVAGGFALCSTIGALLLARSRAAGSS